jgi:signal transduction histidine kinase
MSMAAQPERWARLQGSPEAVSPSTRSRAAGELRGPVAVFRAALLAVCTLLGVPSPQHPQVLFVLLPLAVGGCIAYLSPGFERAWPYVGAVLAAAAIPWTGGAQSPVLPYMLAAGLTLGVSRGRRQLVLAAGAAAGMLLLGAVLPWSMTDGDYLVAGAEWVMLDLAVGLVARWARSLALPVQRDDYVEVRLLLEQLRNLTRNLPGGLDAPNAADALLDRCARLVAHTRSAVVVAPTGGAFVPLAVRGASRVPWRTPLEDGGPVRTAWETGRATLDRRGSALLAIPLRSSRRPFGLVILESHDRDVFTEDVVNQLQKTVNGAAAQLETAMLYEEVRLEASTEERDRLAREMHDGIAQELAFVGYRLDDLRHQAARVDPALAEAVASLRDDLTGLISDIRLSITDLRTTVRPERGLGAALSAYLRAACSGKDVVLNLSLHETAFRLPAEQEGALLKAAQLFAQGVRRAPEVRSLTVLLAVDPPSARLQMSCDSSSVHVDLDKLVGSLVKSGAKVTTSNNADGAPSVDIEMKVGRDDDHGAARRRPCTDPGGAASGVRAD